MSTTFTLLSLITPYLPHQNSNKTPGAKGNKEKENYFRYSVQNHYGNNIITRSCFVDLNTIISITVPYLQVNKSASFVTNLIIGLVLLLLSFSDT